MGAEIGYIEPIMTGAPWRFAAGFAAADVAVEVADDADVLPPLLEHAAAASATQAKPVTKRSDFLTIISPSACRASARSPLQAAVCFGAISGHSIPMRARRQWDQGTLLTGEGISDWGALPTGGSCAVRDQARVGCWVN
jgi:hypothetical protein